jgi:hypothetical protein
MYDDYDSDLDVPTGGVAGGALPSGLGEYVQLFLVLLVLLYVTYVAVSILQSQPIRTPWSFVLM